MFTLATYLGYVLMPSAPITGALLATIAVFLPGFLLLLGVLKNWQAIASKPLVAGALTGVNAAVVGLLLAALYQPIFTSAVSSGIDFCSYHYWCVAIENNEDADCRVSWYLYRGRCNS